MLLKCNFCDPTLTKKDRESGLKSTKSIDIDKDNYVKDEKNKYYHVECYTHHLIKRKKLSKEEAEEKTKEREDVLKEELEELKNKDKFYQWIKSFYDAALPAYYCTQISNIVKGEHEKTNEPIGYHILLDIYEKMRLYLIKNAAKKNFKTTGQRMNYDLAVVIGNYGDYKSYIEKQKSEVETTKTTTTTLSDQKKVSNALKKKEEKEDENFNLYDVLDDILL